MQEQPVSGLERMIALFVFGVLGVFACAWAMEARSDLRAGQPALAALTLSGPGSSRAAPAAVAVNTPLAYYAPAPVQQAPAPAMLAGGGGAPAPVASGPVAHPPPCEQADGQARLEWWDGSRNTLITRPVQWSRDRAFYGLNITGAGTTWFLGPPSACP